MRLMLCAGRRRSSTLSASMRATFEALESRRLYSVSAPRVPAADPLGSTIDFGRVGQRSISVSVTDNITGRPMTFRLAGPGTGQVTVTATGLDLSVTGVSGASTLTVRSTGAAQLHDVNIAGSVRRIDAGEINLAGDLTVSGGVAVMSLGDVSGGHEIRIGAGRQPGRFTFQNIDQASIDSLEPIGLLSARQWIEQPTSRGHLIAPYFGMLKIAGNFEADLMATDSLHGVSIGTLLVSGAVDGAQIRAVLDVQTAIIGMLIDSNIFAGVASGLETVPTAASDFTTDAGIGSISIVGATGTQTIVNSNIAARTIGRIKLGPVDGSNNGSAFGVAAERVGVYRRGPTDASGTRLVTLKNLDTPGVIDTRDDYTLTIL